MLHEDKKQAMSWGLSPEQLSAETTKETYTSEFKTFSPELIDEDGEMFHPHRRCKFVHTEKQLADVRKRVTKTNFNSIDEVNQSQLQDALFKIVLIGASNSGKTSMLLRFVEDTFSDSYLCTIGVDFKIKTLQVDRQPVKLQIWDTAGQERFRSISQAYYRNSHGCIAVYDISSKESFEQISDQIQSFIDYSPQVSAQNIVLVGNKIDLGECQRKVQFAEACELAKQFGLAGAVEASAKEGSQTLFDAFFLATANALDYQNNESVKISGLGQVPNELRRPRFSSDVTAGTMSNNDLSGYSRKTRQARGLGTSQKMEVVAKQVIRIEESSSSFEMKTTQRKKKKQTQQGTCC